MYWIRLELMSALRFAPVGQAKSSGMEGIFIRKQAMGVR